MLNGGPPGYPLPRARAININVIRGRRQSRPGSVSLGPDEGVLTGIERVFIA